MQAAEQGFYDLVLSEDLLAEARDVLERPKMRRYFPEGSVPEYITRVRKAAAMVLGHFTEDVPSYTQDSDGRLPEFATLPVMTVGIPSSVAMSAVGPLPPMVG